MQQIFFVTREAFLASELGISIERTEAAGFGPGVYHLVTHIRDLQFAGIPMETSKLDELMVDLRGRFRIGILLMVQTERFADAAYPEALIIAIPASPVRTPEDPCGILLGGYEMVGAEVKGPTDMISLGTTALRRLLGVDVDVSLERPVEFRT